MVETIERAESVVTLVGPNGAGGEHNLPTDTPTTAEELLIQAEMNLTPGQNYSVMVTRENAVIDVGIEGLSKFFLKPGDELAISSENRGGFFS